MRARWAPVAAAVLLLAACGRDGRGARPPHDGEPPTTAAESEPVADAPTPAPETPAEPTPTPGSADALAEPPPQAVAEPSPPGAPTEAELRAWDRRDPEQEAKRDAWDRANLPRLLRSFDELRCFHQDVQREGERFMADASREPEWFQHRQNTILALDEWLKRFFAENPRILEKSRLVGLFLEAHELVMFTYPKAYTARDRTELDGCDDHWRAVETKVRDRARALGGTLSAAPVRCDPPAKQ